MEQDCKNLFRMKILYVCLNFEGMSIINNFYGGGSVFAPHAREKYYDFHIAASQDCFSGCSKDEKTQNNIVLSQESLDLIYKGDNLKNHIEDLETYNLIAHHHLGTWINTNDLDIPTAIFGIGYMEKVHPNNKNILLFNPEGQKPIFDNAKNHNIYKVQMGRSIPEFQEYKRENFLLQITNQAPCFRGIQVADFCNKHEIKAYFGGPLAENYDLLSHIDNKNTFYLGVVDYKTKIDYLKRARAFVVLNSYPAPFSLSGLESLSYGCPLIALPVGFFPDLVRNGFNGYLINNEAELLDAYGQSQFIQQKNCWKSSYSYNIDEMLSLFSKAFVQIVCSS